MCWALFVKTITVNVIKNEIYFDFCPCKQLEEDVDSHSAARFNRYFQQFNMLESTFRIQAFTRGESCIIYIQKKISSLIFGIIFNTDKTEIAPKNIT